MRQDAGRQGDGRGRAAVHAAAVAATAVAAAAVLLSAPHAVQWAEAGEPGRPTDLTATDVSPTGIDLAWSAPDDDGGEEITGYKIERKEAGKEYAVIEADTDSESTTYEDRDGIKTGTTYVYKVSAINDDGTGDSSAEETARTTESSRGYEQVVPDRPRSLEADDISDSEVRLEWDAPADNDSPPVTGYKIEYKEADEDDDEYEVASSNTGSARTEYTVDDLDEDTEYTFRVSAINSVGTGDPSSEASATPTEESTAEVEAARPGSPRSVSAAPASDASLYVKWAAPAGGRGPEVTAYLIEYKQKEGEWEMAAEVGAGTTAFIHDVPNPKTSYSYRVAARNDVGLGAPSAATGFAKPEHTNKPTQVTITALSPTSARLEWLPPSATFGQAITQFEILKIFSNGVSDRHGGAGGRDTSYTIRDLQTGREHQFAVKAKFSAGASDVSDTVSITLTAESGKGAPAAAGAAAAQSPPGKPGNARATAASHERIDLTWSDPGSSGGSAVTGYRIEFKAGDAGRFETAAADTGSAARAYSHTGLEPETKYTYRVNAISGPLVGPPSDEAAATTLDRAAGAAAAAASTAGGSAGAQGGAGQAGAAGQPGSDAAQGATKGPKPAPPRDLRAERDASQGADLSWSEPASGAGGITSYRLEYRTDGGPYEKLAEPRAGDTSYRHEGLDPASSYTYRLYALNENGQSRASNTASAPAASDAGAGGADSSSSASAADAPAADDPRARVPGFPDPDTDAETYVLLYETDAEFKKWFDEVFPEYEITDVVGEPEGRGESGEMVFPDPNVGLSVYLDLYETDAGFRGWFDETYPDSTVAEVVGGAAGAAAAGAAGAGAGDPRERVPGFPDPATSAREYVDRYETDAGFREWFDETFPEYDIADVVGEPEAAPPPERPDRLDYYKGRYGEEPAYRAWFDSYFFGRALAEVVGTVDRPYGECGAGTSLRDGICQVGPAAGQ